MLACDTAPSSSPPPNESNGRDREDSKRELAVASDDADSDQSRMKLAARVGVLDCMSSSRASRQPVVSTVNETRTNAKLELLESCIVPASPAISLARPLALPY